MPTTTVNFAHMVTSVRMIHSLRKLSLYVHNFLDLRRECADSLFTGFQNGQKLREIELFLKRGKDQFKLLDASIFHAMQKFTGGSQFQSKSELPDFSVSWF